MAEARFGFVILHYCAIDMTKQSVSAIRTNQKGSDYGIVIVDNASGNGTGKELEEFYQGQPDVKVILSTENLGFAKGNNLGFCYARDVLRCDFICVQNNDVMLQQTDFAKRIQEIYKQEPFAVLGPHITLPGGKENAMYYQLASADQLRRERKGYQRKLKRIRSSWYPFWNVWEAAKLRLRVFLGKIHVMPELKLHEDCVEGAHEKQRDLILHGCCLIFSRMYMERYEDAFDPATFMFREEEILYLRCKKAGLPMHYDPSLNVLHMEDVATDFVYKTEKKKEIFHLENQINSLAILIRRLEESEV
jgi:GT2 family glycosyltransferase